VWRKWGSYIKSSDVIDGRTLQSKTHACSNISLLQIFIINDQIVQNPLKVERDMMMQRLVFPSQISWMSVIANSNRVTRHVSDLFLCTGANSVYQIKGLRSFCRRSYYHYLKQFLLAWVNNIVLCHLLILGVVSLHALSYQDCGFYFAVVCLGNGAA
jgi:hypothetical protein